MSFFDEMRLAGSRHQELAKAQKVEDKISRDKERADKRENTRALRSQRREDRQETIDTLVLAGKEKRQERKDRRQARIQSLKDGISNGWKKSKELVKKTGQVIGTAGEVFVGLTQTEEGREFMGKYLSKKSQELTGSFREIGKKTIELPGKIFENTKASINRELKMWQEALDPVVEKAREKCQPYFDILQDQMEVVSRSINIGVNQVEAGVANFKAVQRERISNAAISLAESLANSGETSRQKAQEHKDEAAKCRLALIMLRPADSQVGIDEPVQPIQPTLQVEAMS